MKSWHLYPLISAPMPFQMALDEILFRRLEHGKLPEGACLRFYFSSEPWMTVGYSHPLPEAAGESRTETIQFPENVPVCKRMTGGGRVLHGKDLIFSLIAGKGEDPSFSSVRLSYLKIHEGIKWAFESLGKKPRFFRCDEKLEKGRDCFRHPIPTDLAFGRHKIAGGAQKRSAGILLHQESIQIPKGIDPENLQKAVCLGIEDVFKIKITDGRLHPEWLGEARRLADVKRGAQSASMPASGGLSPR